MMKNTPHLEKNRSHISRIASSAWNLLTDAEKAPYKHHAAILREEHKRKYPSYRFCPKKKGPAKKKIRASKCDSPKDVEHDRQAGAVPTARLDGDKLEAALARIDNMDSDGAMQEARIARSAEVIGVACPFRSPLLPPSAEYHDRSWRALPAATSAAVDRLEDVDNDPIVCPDILSPDYDC